VCGSKLKSEYCETIENAFVGISFITWIGHILHRNCLIQQVIEGKIKGGIEVTGT
jgi:hypothetical protein